MAFLNTVLLGRGGGGISPYTEFAWVTAPNNVTQTCPANTITRLYMNEVVSNGGFGTLNPGGTFPPNVQPTNVITTFLLPIGTYYYEASVPVATGGTTASGILGLYNTTTASYVSRVGAINGHVSYGNFYILKGQLTLTAPTNFYLTFINYYVSYIMNGVYNATSITDATPGAEQRTTIKLWKLA